MENDETDDLRAAHEREEKEAHKDRLRQQLQLTGKQEERLKKLRAEIQLDQVTVSFSLEERRDTRKMSAFYSANATRRRFDLSDVRRSDEKPGWTIEEARLVGCVLSKHVVETVYRDAVKRGVITRGMARAEVPGILTQYDLNIKRLLENEDTDES